MVIGTRGGGGGEQYHIENNSSLSFQETASPGEFVTANGSGGSILIYTDSSEYVPFYDKSVEMRPGIYRDFKTFVMPASNVTISNA